MPAEPSFVTTGDGSVVAVHDLGGSGEPLLLAPATGFPGLVFRQLAGDLATRYHCLAIDLRANGWSWAGEAWAGNWEGFAEDVLAVSSGLDLDRPRAFGHSCGGVALLLAEEASPGTFRHLYCFEPVVIPVLDPPAARPDHPMSQSASRRRARFASRDEALSNFSSKPPLDLLDAPVLEDYVRFGFEDLADGSVELRCSPEDEALIYSYGQSHHAFRDLPRVQCPVDLACGGETAAYGEDALAAIARRLARARVTAFRDLGHLGPLERPDIIADAMIRAFDTPPA